MYETMKSQSEMFFVFFPVDVTVKRVTIEGGRESV